MAINTDVRSEKIKTYKALFEDQVRTISSNGHEWAKFLDYGSRFYKYKFAEQILIYAQKPTATACAPLPLWNNVFDRIVSKGAKGIALLSEKPDGLDTLNYVFDVADTWHKQNHPIKLWRFDKDTHTEVLRETFGDVGDFAEQADAKEIIKHLVDNHIAAVDWDYISDAGIRFIARSVDYIVRNRCGLNDGSELIKSPHYFDDVKQLGQAQFIYIASQIADLSQEILREIEGAVKTFEQQKYIAERGNENGNRVQERRRLSDTGLGVSGTETSGQIWSNEAGLSEGIQEGGIHTPAHGVRAESISGGSGRESIRASESTGGDITGDRYGSGEERTESSMGQTHEQSQESGRGNDVSGTDIPGGILSGEIASEDDEFAAEEAAIDFSSSASIKTITKTEQLSLFPTETEQITRIDKIAEKKRGKSLTQKVRQNPVSEEDIKLALLHGRPRSLGRYETYTLLTNPQMSDEEVIKQLKDSYAKETGHSHPFGDFKRNGHFQSSARGILIQYEFGHQETPTGTFLTWPHVRNVITDLINDGSYISKDEIMIRESNYQKHNDLPDITDKELQLCSISNMQYGFGNAQVKLYEMLYENDSYDNLLDSDKTAIQSLIQNPRNNHYLIMEDDERVSIDIDCDDNGVLFNKKDHNLEYKTWSDYFDFLRVQMQNGTLFEEKMQANRIHRMYDEFLAAFDHDIIQKLDKSTRENIEKANSPKGLIAALEQIPESNFKIAADDGNKMNCKIHAGEGLFLEGKTNLSFVNFCSWNDLVYARLLINGMINELPVKEKDPEINTDIQNRPIPTLSSKVVEKVSSEDVDLALLKRRPHGSNYEIYKILTDTSISAKDAAKEIRQRYGIAEGGTLSFGDGRNDGWYDCSGKGFEISYGTGSNKTSVQLSWAKVCHKYKELINQGKFISEDEIAIREGYYNPDSNLPSISDDEIKGYVSYGCYTSQDNIQLYNLARENKRYSNLSPMDYIHFKQATHSVFYRSRDGVGINTQRDNEGVLFIKKNTKLEFKTWDELYEVFRTEVLQGKYFSDDVIDRVRDHYDDIVDFLDSDCAPPWPTEETPSALAENLSKLYPPTNIKEITLESGETVTVTPNGNGISLEFELEIGKTERKYYSWLEAACAFHFIKSQAREHDQEKTLEPEQKERLEEHEITPVEESGSSTKRQAAVSVMAPHEPDPHVNYVITDENRIGKGTPAEKARNNVAAIRLLKDLQNNNAKATSEQQEVLARYVGWGGLANVFDEKSETGWQAETRQKLKELLTEKEYRAARASTLTAFYTPSSVIKGIYSGLRQMGFEGGNVLEPAMGTGNFFGLLPEGVSKSKLHGVELDEITGQIARQLYQKANISVCGFEDTSMPDNFFDVAVGNVPFGNFKVSDRTYDKHNFLIHDYFFAKALDKVRPGGVVAFVTSKGTLDKANPVVRKYLAQRAELLGAIRLPNNTMLANAGTEVTSDILFLQKHERQIDIVPDWVGTSMDDNGIPMNQYFVDNPQMILGTMAQQKSLYGNETETTCLPIPGMDLQVSLEKVIRENIHGEILDYHFGKDDVMGKREEITTLPANPNIKNHSYTLVDNDVYYRENSVMNKVTGLSSDNLFRLKHLVELRELAKVIIELQLDGGSDEQIQVAQSTLNNSYDRFAIRFGRINEKANTKIFEKDSGYYLLCSLEIFDQNRNFVRKSPFFSQRTIRNRDIPESVGTATDALALSLAEKAEVDMEYMCRLTGFDEQTIVDDLKNLIFVNPAKSTEHKTIFETAAEYLSGNVRMKLKQANLAERAFPDKYKSNIEALEKVIPKFLHANEIDVRLGSTWVDDQYVKDFIHQTIMPKSWVHIRVEYVPYDSSWVITGKGADKDSNVRANSTYGTSRASAYDIIEDTLNLRDTRVFDIINDPDTGKEKRVINIKETAKAQLKQEEIKQLFRDWIFKDPERREHLVNKYNERYNCIRPREYDGSGLKFYGMNPEIGLQKHQSDAVARILYGPNTLLAHEVGAGKTFVMAAGIMESKRIGLCKKGLWIVPNHLTEQTAAEFLSLYPGANILVATKKDFEMKNRKKFCARITTGDYDAIIMGFTQFEKIPISVARQRQMLTEQIDEIVEMKEQLEENTSMRTTVKRMEKTRKSLEVRLNRLNDQSKKDDVVTFEELGIDHLVVDEAHNYKNLYFSTKMRNVAGLSQTEAQKSSDMYMKCRYMDEITDSKGVVFATGTPISNSMTEMYTMMSYLQGRELRNLQLHHFDAWASNFGETVAAVELAPEGTGYRSKTRFAKFFNLPELMTMFKTSADIKTADMLQLPRPEANYHTVSVEPTEFQKELMQSLSDRATAVHNKVVDPHIDNMLKITSDGRKIGLDQRLYDPALPDQPGTKANVCAENVFNIWEKNKDIRATQLIFCDFSTPSKDKFNLYDDMKEKLLAKGIPEKEIAFIHDADTEKKKADVFAQVRAGQIRVLLGSTAKMGAGTNVQDKLIASHDLDCPWRPSDLEQRAGRIVRQGNTNKSVDIFRYVTKDTFDAYLYQTIEKKQTFISQIMTSKNPVRSCEDVDESVLKYAEIKALCAGNPKIKEKMDLEVKVAKLQIAKSNYLSNKYTLEDKILKHLPARISSCEEDILTLEKDWGNYQKHLPLNSKVDGEKQESVFAGITFENQICTTKESAGNRILEIRKKLQHGNQNIYVGEYLGFNMQMNYSVVNKEFFMTLTSKENNGRVHSVALGDSAQGNIARIDNKLEKISTELANAKLYLEEYKNDLTQCEADLLIPFSAENELKEYQERLNVLNIELNLEHNPQQENPIEETSAKKDTKGVEKISEKNEKRDFSR